MKGLFFLCFIILLSGCATQGITYRSYPGDQLSNEKIATLDTSNGFFVGSIDGIKIPPQPKPIAKIELLPGKHVFTVYATADYNYTIYDSGPYSTTIYNNTLSQRVGGQSIELDAQAGHMYKLDGVQHMTYVKPMITDTAK
jgi:hypothetical protein